MSNTLIDPLVHISIGTHVNSENQLQSIVVHERPFIGNLQLDSDPDNPDLLIAVGEMLGVKQPLSSCRLTCLGQLAILWLDHDRWLVLRAPGQSTHLAKLLEKTFGNDIQLNNEQETLTAHLNEAAINYLLNSDNTHEYRMDCSEYRFESLQALKSRSIQVHIVEPTDNYEILVRKSFANILWEWLNIS